MAAVHPPTGSLLKHILLWWCNSCVRILSFKAKATSCRDNSPKEIPLWSSSQTVRKTLGKPWNSWQNHSLGPKVTCTFEFQGPGYGCCASTNRFIPQTYYSELCNACLRLRTLAEGTSCRKNFPELNSSLILPSDCEKSLQNLEFLGKKNSSHMYMGFRGPGYDCCAST